MNPSQEPAPQHYEQAGYSYGPPPPEVVAWEQPRPLRRSWSRMVSVAVLLTVALAVAGAPLGLLWSWLSPSVPVINAGQNGIVVNDPSPEEYIAADGWFTLLGFGFGLLVAVLIWLVLRRDRGPALLLGVAFGGLACSVVAWQVGRLVGLSAWNSWQDTSAPGDTYSRPPDLQAYGALLVIAFAAVIVTTLLAGWSNDPDLERPGAKPGYGNNLDDELSSGSPDGPGPTAAPAPPAPWPADPPRG
ncbi:DUF2567 domain-containing protein [Actinoplanes friuliensis]|uniref:ABC transporter permease n=1 Tax=Actinoplanes friuliensis DSM 7358 TaxID=1246995 RepID=U5VTI7_9ACTN|nr:DUF2567 domain-containing protein [Actinoplanes friuliensis]AGZ40308.1 hypothetical protein AFR_10095 [Actinoplanes friuliensis DSM 7358]